MAGNDGEMDSWTVWTDGPTTLHKLGWKRPHLWKTQGPGLVSSALWRRLLEWKTLFAAGSDTIARKGWNWLLAVGQSRGSQFDLLRQVPSDARTHLGSVACLALGGQGFTASTAAAGRPSPAIFHLSLLCPVDLEAASCHAALMMVPAVAALNAVRSVLGAHPAGKPGRLGIKWVNDLLCDGKKLGGVLTAARTLEGRLTSVTFGIGLNVAVTPDTGDDPWQTPAICLHQAATGATPTLGSILLAIARPDPALPGSTASPWPGCHPPGVL